MTDQRSPHELDKLLFQEQETEAPFEPELAQRFYDWHPKSALALGKGFQESDLTDDKRAFLIFEPQELDSGSPAAEVDLVYVKDNETLNKTIKRDTKVSASYLGGSASAEYGFKSESKFARDTITVVMIASANYGRWGIPANATLSPDAKRDISNSTLFAQRYGERYVSTETRGARIAVLITLESVSRSSINSFNSKFSASGGWGSVSGSAKSSFSTLLTRAAKQDRASIKAKSVGGEGLSSLEKSLKALTASTKDPLPAMMSALAETLGTFSKANASPISYVTSSMSDYDWDSSSNLPWTSPKQRFLAKLKSEFDRARREIDFIRDFQNGEGDFYHFRNEEHFQHVDLNKAIESLQDYLDDVVKLHQAVKQNIEGVALRLPYPQPSFVDESYYRRGRPPWIEFKVGAFPASRETGYPVIVDGSEAAAIVSLPHAARLDAMRSHHPEAEGYYAWFSLHIHGPIGLRQKIRFSDGWESISNEIAFSITGNDVTVFPNYAHSDTSNSNLETNLLAWMAKQPEGSWACEVTWLLRDTLNRTFDVKIADCKWKIDSNRRMKGARVHPFV